VQSTSIEAYRSRVLPCLAQSQATVYQILKDASRNGFDMTNNEIASALHWSICRVTGRVKELRDAGVVVKSQKRRCGVTQNRVYAWKVK
jgi:predicted transcriptional regulator